MQVSEKNWKHKNAAKEFQNDSQERHVTVRKARKRSKPLSNETKQEGEEREEKKIVRAKGGREANAKKK